MRVHGVFNIFNPFQWPQTQPHRFPHNPTSIGLKKEWKLHLYHSLIFHPPQHSQDWTRVVGPIRVNQNRLLLCFGSNSNPLPSVEVHEPCSSTPKSFKIFKPSNLLRAGQWVKLEKFFGKINLKFKLLLASFYKLKK